MAVRCALAYGTVDSWLLWRLSAPHAGGVMFVPAFAGVHSGLDELTAQWQVDRRFEPDMPRDSASQRMADGSRAVRQATAP